MRTITRLVRKENKVSADDKEYTFYLYQLDDGSEVGSLQEFKVGEEVSVWFDDRYNRSKLRKKR